MEQFTKIKASELKKENIYYKDEEAIKKLAKAVKAHNKAVLFMITPIALVLKLSIIMMLISCFVPSEGEPALGTAIMFILMSSVLIYVEHIIKKENKAIKVALKEGPSKLQCGELRDKYIEIDKDENGVKRYYYVDVVFPREYTEIKKIQVPYSLYSDIKKGDKMLVVSFDGKKAYCIKEQ